MKRFWIKQVFVALLCMVAIVGFTGCSDDDDSSGPANIAGLWGCAISGTWPDEGPFTLDETMTIAQNGQNVTGSYTYDGVTYTFSGTYVDGELNAVDSEGWAVHLEFEENSADGTFTGTYDNGTPGVENVRLTR